MLLRLLKAWAQLVERYPRSVIGATVFITALAVLGMARLTVDAAQMGHLSEADEVSRLSEEMERRFGSEVQLAVVVEGADVLLADTLERLRQLTGDIQRVDGIAEVLYPLNARRVRVQDDALEVAPMAPDAPVTPAVAKELQAELMRSPLYRGRLVAEDQKSALVVITIEQRDGEDQRYKTVILEQLRALLARYPGPERLGLFGGLVVTDTAMSMARADLRLLVLVTSGALLIALWLCFRTWRGAWLTVAAALLALGWVMGWRGVAGTPLTVASLFLVPVLIANTCTYVIHVLGEYDEVVVRGSGTVGRVIERFMLPQLLSTVTTVIGFLSLAVSGVSLVDDVGWYGALGAGLGMVVAVAFAPAMVRLSKTPGRAFVRHNPGLTGFLDRHAYAVLKHRKKLLWGSLAVVVFTTAGVSFLKADTDFLSYFPRGTPLRQAHAVINQRHGGGESVYLQVDTQRPGGAVDVGLLTRVQALEAAIRVLPGVGSVGSPVPLLGELHRALLEDPAAPDLPATAPALEQILFLGKGESELKQHLSFDDRYLRLTVGTTPTNTADKLLLYERIEAAALEVLGPAAPARVLGRNVLIAVGTKSIVDGQIRSLALASLLIGGLMIALFRSFRMGLLVMLPNLLPTAMLFGIMGWLAIPLTPITALVACTALGIAVDDTIHFLVRFYRELRDSGHYIIQQNMGLKRTDEQSIAMMKTLTSSGQAIVITTVTLVVGFAAMAVSSFQPVLHTGLLSSITMVVCLLGDLVMLPALLISVRV